MVTFFVTAETCPSCTRGRVYVRCILISMIYISPSFNLTEPSTSASETVFTAPMDIMIIFIATSLEYMQKLSEHMHNAANENQRRAQIYSLATSL